MKALFFECYSGISGNMTLGALLEIVGDEKYLSNELKKLKVDGYHLHIDKVVKNGITATHVDVHIEEHQHNHDHHHQEHVHDHHHHQEHTHHHVHRNLFDVNKIIEDSDIDSNAKELAKRIFMRVALAESKVHNEPLENVHFHEVGAIDSIIDIIGTAVLINKINPDIIYSSVVNDGYGFIECAHGTIPVPVPATSEIFAASQVVTRQIDIDTELVTPTGAAIIAELASTYGVMPTMNVKKIGWGAGTKELKIPNILKVSYGEINEEKEDVVVIETNIDDCSSEILGYTFDKLIDKGALDAYFSPIFMKKSRPAYKLSIICFKKDLERMTDILFEETTTIGIRYYSVDRVILSRIKEVIDTKYGKIEVKKVNHNGKTFLYPEFESLKRISIENNIPIKELYKLIK